MITGSGVSRNLSGRKLISRCSSGSFLSVLCFTMFALKSVGDLSFGRQMGSYPILVGIPVRLPERSVIDAVVVDWGMRSVTALPVPIRDQHASCNRNKMAAGCRQEKSGGGAGETALHKS